MSISTKLHQKADSIFIAKLASGNYEAYKDNKKLRNSLYQDCLKQAIACEVHNGKVCNTTAFALAQ